MRNILLSTLSVIALFAATSAHADENDILIDQVTSNNQATVNQGGSHNETNIYQQGGNGNIASSDQQGANNEADIHQTGTANILHSSPKRHRQRRGIQSDR